MTATTKSLQSAYAKGWSPPDRRPIYEWARDWVKLPGGGAYGIPGWFDVGHSRHLIDVFHAYQDFHLLMPLYVCRQWQGIPTPQEGQGIRWFYPNALAALAMPPADAPLVQALRDYL